jgi:glycosyltransferase involved in cell wall biosynthesis
VTGQPLVPANDWRVLRAPELGAWQPTLSVSVVIPAHDPGHLDLVLAALAAQSYPAHLLEVVVVDDGSRPPVVLPELRPEHTRLVLPGSGWGPGPARRAGADQCEGQVLHWLDADMVASRHEVEAHQRWHHLVDYAVVLGSRVFVGDDAFATTSPADLHRSIADGTPPATVADGPGQEVAWVSRILAETDHLALAGPRAMRVHVTASSSVRRELYAASGGFPPGVRFGEDTVLGYRLREAGAVFVPDPAAVSAHVGDSRVQRAAEEVNRYAKPFITDLVPEYRGHRLQVPRSFAVPYVEVAVPVADTAFEAVRALVDQQLAGSVPDLVVTLLAPWSGLDEGRRPVLDDPQRDLHLLRVTYAAEPRVRLRDTLTPTCDATFRLGLPDASHFPAGRSLEELLHAMEEQHLGVVTLRLPSGEDARLERTAAAARARRVAPEDPRSLDGLVYPAERRDALAAGFVTPDSAKPLRQVRGLVAWGVKPAPSAAG